MGNKQLTLPRSERLSWKRRIDMLFASGSSFVAHPLRVIYLPVKRNSPERAAAVLINVSKKRLKHAVDRNFVKRRIRESYRLHKGILTGALADGEWSMLAAFLYVDNKKMPFVIIEKAMTKALLTLGTKVR